MKKGTKVVSGDEKPKNFGRAGKDGKNGDPTKQLLGAGGESQECRAGNRRQDEKKKNFQQNYWNKRSRENS